MSHRWVRLAALAVVLALFAAACSGSGEDNSLSATTSGRASSSGSSPDDGTEDVDESADAPGASEPGEGGSPVDACSLLTLDEIGEIMGGVPSQGEVEGSPAPFYGCRWDGGSFAVGVSVISWSSTEEARDSFDLFLGDVTEVDGVGDAALSNILTDLAFITGSYEVTIDVLVDADDATEAAMAKEFALLVIPRLP